MTTNSETATTILIATTTLTLFITPSDEYTEGNDDWWAPLEGALRHRGLDELYIEEIHHDGECGYFYVKNLPPELCQGALHYIQTRFEGAAGPCDEICDESTIPAPQPGESPWPFHWDDGQLVTKFEAEIEFVGEDGWSPTLNELFYILESQYHEIGCDDGRVYVMIKNEDDHNA